MAYRVVVRTLVNEHSKIYLSSSSSLQLFIVNRQSGSVIPRMVRGSNGHNLSLEITSGIDLIKLLYFTFILYFSFIVGRHFSVFGGFKL